MTAVSIIASRLPAAFGVVCAILVALFVFAAYNGHGDKIAEVGCGLTSDTPSEWSTCVYNATN